jgi:hypothetical protein
MRRITRFLLVAGTFSGTAILPHTRRDALEANALTMNRKISIGPCRFNLGEFFDRAGRLLPLGEVPPDVQAEIASFEVVRITTRSNGETVTTEELIRVKTRDRRTARVVKRGLTTATARSISEKPLGPRLVTTRERSVGSGSTAAAAAHEGQCEHS